MKLKILFIIFLLLSSNIKSFSQTCIIAIVDPINRKTIIGADTKFVMSLTNKTTGLSYDTVKHGSKILKVGNFVIATVNAFTENQRSAAEAAFMDVRKSIPEMINSYINLFINITNPQLLRYVNDVNKYKNISTTIITGFINEQSLLIKIDFKIKKPELIPYTLDYSLTYSNALIVGDIEDIGDKFINEVSNFNINSFSDNKGFVLKYLKLAALMHPRSVSEPFEFCEITQNGIFFDPKNKYSH